MKLAIHKNIGSFSERWIDYCEKEDIEFKIVNCYESNIIEQLKGCDALLWNWNNTDYKAMRFAKQLTYSLETVGKSVFPNSKTCWHYDDKVGQKYLLESINIPFVTTDVFYDKKTALKWIKNETFPKVFKLSGGAGATNVKLAKSKEQAKSFINQSFGKGFSQIDRFSKFKDYFNTWKRNKNIQYFIQMLRAFARIFIQTEFEKMQGYEKGYIYFQEFIPHNTFDIRVITVGNKAFAIKRMTRDGDFRASGSGKIMYEKEEIDIECIKIAFKASKLMNTQCTAYDFVFDSAGNPLIIEISYAFLMTAYDNCEGYWDEELNWYNETFNPEAWMIKNLIKNL